MRSTPRSERFWSGNLRPGLGLLAACALIVAGLSACAPTGGTYSAPPAPIGSNAPAAPQDSATASPTAPTPGGPEPMDAGALALLATLPVKGKAPITGYARTADFGAAWLDVDHNGCDTRDDILARDLTSTVKADSCRVLSGELVSPYTQQLIHFVRGNTTSTAVQIDHVVSLGNAWQTGAQQLSLAEREALANDPINLFAVDGRSNEQKGDGDTATWLPAAKSFRCVYVGHQVSVKAAYRLWVTPAEHDAMVRVLSSCTDARALTSTSVPAPGADDAPAPGVAPTPATDVVHSGAYCRTSGARWVTATGTPMVCSLKAPDPRLRWRSL